MTPLSPELTWLTWTAVLTALLWVPYIVNRVIEIGNVAGVMSPEPPTPAKAAWPERLRCAHDNAAVGLAVFAALVLAAQVSGHTDANTALAAQVYFWARLAHAVVYAAGIPLARTLAFTVAFLCQVTLACALLG